MPQQPQPAQPLPGQQAAGPRRARRALADGPAQVPGETAEDAHGPAGHPALDHTPPQAHPLPPA
ncbi:hypothetical protein AB8B12_33245, partial [Streptomyces sp. PGLac3x]